MIADRLLHRRLHHARHHLGAHRREWSVLAVLAGLLAVLALAAPAFFSAANLRSVLVEAAPLLVAAVGMTALVLARQIDISIGAQVSVCGTAAALMAQAGWPLPAVLAATVAIGAVLGGLNALLVVALGVPAIVATLASLVVLEESLRWWRSGEQIRNLSAHFQWAGLGQDAGRWAIIAVAGLVLAGGWFVLRHIAAGRAVYAVGCDAEAARLCGMRPRRVVAGAFVAMGALSAVAGLLSAMPFRSVQPDSGHGLELKIIAAVVVGGVAITGGRGSVIGAAIGVLLLTALRPALVFLHCDATWEKAILGGIILVAVASDALRPGRTGKAGPHG